MGKKAGVGEGHTAMSRNKNTVNKFQPGWAYNKRKWFKISPPGYPALVPRWKSQVPEINKTFNFYSQPVYSQRLKHLNIGYNVLKMKRFYSIVEKIVKSIFLAWGHG
jgi:hypothetical protein